jgi:hypothetical protein
LVNVIRKNLLAEFACLLLLLNRITTVRRQRRKQPHLSPDYNEKRQKNSCCSCGRDNSRELDGKDIRETLAEALKRVAASDKPRVYWTCKKYLQDDYGLL